MKWLIVEGLVLKEEMDLKWNIGAAWKERKFLEIVRDGWNKFDLQRATSFIFLQGVLRIQVSFQWIGKFLRLLKLV